MAILIADPALLSPVATREVVFLSEAVTLQSFQEQRPACAYIPDGKKRREAEEGKRVRSG